MIATIWLFSILSTTMLREIECMYENQIIDYDLSGPEPLIQQESIHIAKRTKPSLSIVNPLDVLRQRLMLELARRHMRDNTKQVELNRAILKTVGKRVNQLDYLDFHRYKRLNQRIKLYQIQNQNDDELHIKYLFSLKYYDTQ